MDVYYLKKCAKDCGYIFVAWSNNSKFCNKCGGHGDQARVCKVGGKRTDFAVLVELAKVVRARKERDDFATGTLDRLLGGEH